MMRFLVSSKIEGERIPTFLNRNDKLGSAHYSWKIIAQMYHSGLTNIGADVRDLDAPDIYQSPLSQKVAGIRGDEISLVVKPSEFIRPCFGLRNIAICGWEFPEFSDDCRHGNPRTNQIGMLKTVDEIWCWSSFTTNNLKKYGVNARRLPPPVTSFATLDTASIATVPCVVLNSEDGYDLETLQSETMPLGQTGTAKGRTFLAVINPWDKRKQIATLVAAAAKILKGHDRLLVKLIIDNDGTKVSNINAILAIHHDLKIRSDNVLFIGQNLNQSQMNQLYCSSDFYLSSSSAEGLNLPLIEAMNKGVPGITTNATAMADYIDSDNAILVPAKRKKTGPSFHFASEYLETTHFPPTKQALEKAIDQAIRLTVSQRRVLGKNAQNRVQTLFGSERFAEEIQRAL